MMKRNPSPRLSRLFSLAAIVAVFASFTFLSCGDDQETINSTRNLNDSTRPNKLGDIDTIETRLAAGIIGSAHDFTQSGAHARDFCTPCHTPHIEDAKAPLLDKRPAATDRLRPYEAVGIDLDGASLLCLSCHDGVIATDVYTASHATGLARQLGSSQLGIGGLTGHPIGIAYPIADPRYNPPGSLSATDGRIPLPDGRVQCISCHDPHNTGRHPGMLVRSNRGSGLCLSCHRL